MILVVRVDQEESAVVKNEDVLQRQVAVHVARKIPSALEPWQGRQYAADQRAEPSLTHSVDRELLGREHLPDTGISVNRLRRFFHEFMAQVDLEGSGVGARRVDPERKIVQDARQDFAA